MFPAQRYRETQAEIKRAVIVRIVREAACALRRVNGEFATSIPYVTREAIVRMLDEVQARLEAVDEMMQGASERQASLR